jgi:hypothetical protein
MQPNSITSFAFPAKALYGKKVTKEKIYQYASPTAAVKQKFIQQIDKIVWQYKLAPETINLPATKQLAEIQVFDVWLKDGVSTSDLDENLLKVIDKAISMPLYYRLFAGDNVKFCMAYKRPSDADSNKWVVETYFATPWQHAEKVKEAAQPLPIALNIQGLYEQLLRSVVTEPAKPGETLQAQMERISQTRSLAKALENLTAQLIREKQFNRQIDINRQINIIKQQLASL